MTRKNDDWLDNLEQRAKELARRQESNAKRLDSLEQRHTFPLWLAGQTERADHVGALARDVTVDPVLDGLDYHDLASKLRARGSSLDEQRALLAAWREFSFGRTASGKRFPYDY